MTASMFPESLGGSIASLGDGGSALEQDGDYTFPEGPLNTPLHAAAVNGNKSLLQRLINEDANASLINTGDRFGRTPLVYSVLGDRLDCAEILLKNGASVSLADVDGRTPLHWAAYQGNHKCVKLLLSKGGNWKAKDTEGRTPLHFAASYNSSKCLSLLLKMAAKGEVDDPDNNSMTALHWGASFGNAEHVKMLLKYKASVLLKDAEQKTPLHWAATNHNASVVKLILEESTDMINWRDTEGRTSLHLAVAQQNEAVVRALLSVETCDASIQDNTYRAPLHWAAVLGNSKIVKQLLCKNADYHSKDGNGATPLHYCAQNNLSQTVEVFLSFSKMKDIPDKEGQTAIIWASGKGASAALETMLHHNLDVHATDKSGGTALHAAAYAGQHKCVQLLLQHGASVNALDRHNHTPIFRACETGHTEVVVTLLENGAIVTLEDQDGRSPLHWAALGGHTHICQTLIKNVVPADKKDRLGCTPLHCAAYGGFVNCMSILTDYGAQVNAVDKEGISALHWSCSSGHLEAVKLLLRHGAFLNFMENDGERLTPLDYAIFGDHQDVAQYMIEQGGLTITAIQDVAATAIQACWRGYRVRKPFQNRKNLYIIHEQLKKDLHMKKQEEMRRRLHVISNGNLVSPGQLQEEEDDLMNDAHNVNENVINGRASRRDGAVLVSNRTGMSSVELKLEVPEDADEYLEELAEGLDSRASYSDFPPSLSTIFEQSFSDSQRDFRNKLNGMNSTLREQISEAFENGENESGQSDGSASPEKRISEQIGEILRITAQCEEESGSSQPTRNYNLNASSSNTRIIGAVSAPSSDPESIRDSVASNSVDGRQHQLCTERADSKANAWAARARKERERLHMIRTKVNAATSIQRWFRRVRTNKKDRRETRTAMDEILMDQEELRQQIAALVIQLCWRRYIRRKAKLDSAVAIEDGVMYVAVCSTNGNANTETTKEDNKNIDTQAKFRDRRSLSNADNVKQIQSRAIKSAEHGRTRAKSGVLPRRPVVFPSRISTSTDSRRSRKSAPSPAAVSYNLALDMYNPLSTRRSANDRPSVPRRGNNRVRPSSHRKTVTGWGGPDSNPRSPKR